MNNRQKELLRVLLVRDEIMNIKVLAEQLDCAEKTVRNDLDRIEEFICEFPEIRVIRKPGQGISIEGSKEDRSKVLQALLSGESKSSEERLFEMAFQLLTSQKPMTLQHFADLYYVPKAAIKKDIETISEWLERYELEIVSKPRVGNGIQGPELKKRNALAHLSELNPSAQYDKKAVLDLFLPYEIMVVKKAMQEMQRTLSIAYTEEAANSLLVHALVMVKRTRQSAAIFVQPSERQEASRRKEYQYAKFLFASLEGVFSMTFPEEERVYFTWHLVSSKRVDEGRQQGMKMDEETANLVQSIIDKMDRLTLMPFGKDVVLANGLAVHMHSVINRIKFGFPITNPLLSNIKKMYPYMFNMVMLALDDVRESCEIEIPEDEAAYIVLHFQASIERLEKKRDKKKKAIIVCHMGIGMSHLLEAKIEQQYQDIEILACIGRAELNGYLQEHSADFIISTIPLEKITEGHIVISPLFGQEDKEKLSQFIKGLDQKQIEHNENEVFTPFLSEELVFFNVKTEHRYEVVEMLGNALFSKGYVSREYIHSAVNRERSSSTAVGGGIAIPHGNPAMVKKTALAVAIMEEPIEWGNERVTLIFMLAIAKQDQGNVRGIIGRISSLSETPLVVHALTGSRDYMEFIALLERK
jgi:activator of the mannose operon, transcriptional antiterminator